MSLINRVERLFGKRQKPCKKEASTLRVIWNEQTRWNEFLIRTPKYFVGQTNIQISYKQIKKNRVEHVSLLKNWKMIIQQKNIKSM